MKRPFDETESRREAFEEFFATHYRPVRDFVRRRAPDSAVEDIVAETFLVAWRRFAEMSGDPLPWLLGVARRVLANQLRGEQRRAALLDRLERSSVRSSWEPESAPAMPGKLAEALVRLSDQDREILLLVAWDGLDPSDAARVLGCSLPAFRVRLHRARRRITKELAEGVAVRPVANLTKEIQ